MLIPDRRTLIVLGSLIGAMTLVSGLLLVLEPGPVAPLEGISLSAVDRAVDPAKLLFDTRPEPRENRWSAIVVYYSGTPAGSADTIDRTDRRLGLDGLGCHFVVNNGRGGDDGDVEMGYRWVYQRDGAYCAGRDGRWFNQNAIGICLIGRPDQQPPTDRQVQKLVWLVRQLQTRFNIPAANVIVSAERRIGRDAPVSPGPYFPLANFRQRLLTTASP